VKPLAKDDWDLDCKQDTGKIEYYGASERGDEDTRVDEELHGSENVGETEGFS